MTGKDWSYLAYTDMGYYVLDAMASNPCLLYHNDKHIEKLYCHAAQADIEYDVNLDAAILWHDAVYDNQPEKERRSVDLMLETAYAMPHWFEELDLTLISEMIMTTVTHKIDEVEMSTLAKLDLMDLTDPQTAYNNFHLLLQEGRLLYGKTTQEVAKATSDFLKNLHGTMLHNMEVDVEDHKYWHRVADGVAQTILMANTVADLPKEVFRN